MPETRKIDWTGAARRFAMVAATTLLTGCVATMGGGSEGGAGCAAYSEARLSIPAVETIAGVPAPWASWIADTDDRMTGTCR